MINNIMPLERRNNQPQLNDGPDIAPSPDSIVQKPQATLPVPGDYYLDPESRQLRKEILEKVQQIRRGQY